jgi:hypothetical protein
MTDSWIDDDWFEDIDYSEPEPDPYMYVMGMDPGGTTGVAMLRIDLEDEKAKPVLIYLHQIADGRYGFKEFFGGSAIGPNLTVVSEKWRERNVKGADREPQYIEGGIHMLWGDENVEWQYPDVKDVITDDYLKSQNLWTPGMPHQMDALRHALAYLRNSGHSGTLDTMNPDGDGETIAQPGDADEAQLGQGQGEPGEGEPGPSFEEAMAAMAQAVMAAQEVVDEAFAEAFAEGEPTGDAPGQKAPGGYGETPDDGLKRSKRERNGAFAGFNPVDYEEGGTTLLDD